MAHGESGPHLSIDSASRMPYSRVVLVQYSYAKIPVYYTGILILGNDKGRTTGEREGVFVDCVPRLCTESGSVSGGAEK